MRLPIQAGIAAFATVATGYADPASAAEHPRTVVYVGTRAGEPMRADLHPALLKLKDSLIRRLKNELIKQGGDPSDLNAVQFLPGDYVGDQTASLPLRWKKYHALFLLWGENEEKKSGYRLRHQIYFGDMMGRGAHQFEGVNGILRMDTSAAALDLHLILLGYAILLDSVERKRDKLILPLANAVISLLEKSESDGSHRTSPCRQQIRKGVQQIVWAVEHHKELPPKPNYGNLICTTSAG
jgi:hypothetical protein